jgi:hypothetical protein
MEWPDYFPSGCPSTNAVPATGQVWRLVLNSPPTADDFIPHKLLFPERDWNEAECKACGLSIYRDARDASRARNRVPALRAHRIASGNLVESDGVMLPTPSHASQSHETWWVPQAVEPWRSFAVITEPEAETTP